MDSFLMFNHTVVIEAIGAYGCVADTNRNVVIIDPSMIDLARKFPGIICHEIGHLDDPAADWHILLKPGMTMVEVQIACFYAHCSKKAMCYEVAADGKAVEMGEGHSLLMALKKIYSELGAAAGADLPDRITRLEVWEKTGKFINDGATTVPSKDEIFDLIGPVAMAQIEIRARKMLEASGIDPDALAE